MPESLPPILIADDDPDDLFFTHRILQKGGVKNPVLTFKDGEEVIEFLKGVLDEPAKPETRPCLLFLDIKMPRCDGFEVLGWSRQQAGLAGLHIAILSGSDEPRDRKRAASLGANHYLVKPAEQRSLTSVVDAATKK
jgi:CheY-like chemotaxis protein